MSSQCEPCAQDVPIEHSTAPPSELPTPLTAIGGHLELLVDAANDLTGERQTIVDVAMRNVSRLANFIDDLLHLSRPDDPSLSQRERVDVAAVAQRTTDAVAGMVDRRGATQQIDFALYAR